ncbi:MAG: DUF4203 domain-containing protein [Acidobacteriota bacterium]
MLPASLQLPAAVLLIVGGLLSCFAGYRLFRVILGVYGFIFGALLASSVMGADQTGWLMVAVIGGGLVGALILITAYFVGVALIGAGLGAMVADTIWASFGREAGLVPVIILAILGALAALALQRYVIIISTAFGGAQTAIVGGAALIGNRAADASVRGVYRVYPLDPLPASKWDVVAWLILGFAGLAVQLGVTAKGRK